MIRNDLPLVLSIENECFYYAWEEEDFISVLRKDNCIGMVVEEGDVVMGYMVYALHKKHIELLSIGVHPDVQNMGYGTAMIDRLKEKIDCQRRHTLTLNVRETDLQAQLFLRNRGFVASKIMRGHFDNGEDAYAMSWRQNHGARSIESRA